MKAMNGRGLEGFPLQLLILFIIIAAVLPLTWNYLDSYSMSQAENVIEDQFQYLEAAVRDVYSMGPGNVRVVQMDIDGGIMSDVEYVKIGGEPGDAWSNLSSCRYRIMGQQEQFLLISNPNIAMVNLTRTLEIGTGTWKITVTSMDEMQVRTDVDGDGQLFSRFVEVGLA